MEIAMAKPYSKDLRERVIRCVEDGSTMAAASRLYRIDHRTVERWCKRKREEGTAAARPLGRPVGTGKIDLAALEADVAADPDKTLVKRGELFGASDAGVLKAMRRLKVSFKKNAAL
jgi:transposase